MKPTLWDYHLEYASPQKNMLYKSLSGIKNTLTGLRVKNMTASNRPVIVYYPYQLKFIVGESDNYV